MYQTNTGREKELRGDLSYYVNEFEGITYVYIGDTILASYTDCPNGEQAVEMAMEDFCIEEVS